MIITLQLKLELSNKTHKQLEDLENQKKLLNKKQYKKEKNLILKNMRKELKQINKEHPFEKEIQKLINEDIYE